MQVAKIHRHVDPMRFPKVQKPLEDKAKEAFKPVELFGDIVETMVAIRKEKR